jgi:cobalamin synthase
MIAPCEKVKNNKYIPLFLTRIPIAESFVAYPFNQLAGLPVAGLVTVAVERVVSSGKSDNN